MGGKETTKHNSKFTKDKTSSYCVRSEQGQSGHTAEAPFVQTSRRKGHFCILSIDGTLYLEPAI